MTSATTISICTSISTAAVLKALGQAYERSCGVRVSIAADAAKTMMSRIRGGERADLAILGGTAVSELIAEGIVARRTERPFSRSIVGIGVRAGAPKPDISTVEAFKRTLLEAKSIAHTVHGASGMYFPTLAQRLGIARETAAKTVTRPGGLIGRVVVAGEAELAFQQIAELLAVPGLEVVGPIPKDVQKVFQTNAGIFAVAGNPEEAERFLRFATASSQAALFAEKGLELAAG